MSDIAVDESASETEKSSQKIVDDTNENFTEEKKPTDVGVDDANDDKNKETVSNEKTGADDETAADEHVEEGQGEEIEGEENEKVEGEEKEKVEGEEKEKVEGEEKEKVEGEYPSEAGEGDAEDVEKAEGEHPETCTQKRTDEWGEELLGEEELKVEEEEKKEDVVEEEVVEEEPEYVEEPVDPAAPLNLTDSKDALRSDFELRPEQLAEVEKIWEIYQDYTPAYTNLDGCITVKELVYMLKALLLMTYTEEQLMELITFVCRPPDDNGYITYEQFLRMVIIRQRDLDIEEELRSALQVLDPGRTGEVQSDELKEVLSKLGNKLAPKMLDDFIKEIDLSGGGKIGIEDVVAICGMDLRKDDVLLPAEEPEEEEG